MKKILSLIVVAAMAMPLVACGSDDSAKEAEKLSFTAGTYESTAKGFGGDIVVSVEVSEDEILSVNVTGDSETDGIGSVAVAEMGKTIVEKQSADVDTVANATISSNAIIEAAKAALEQASK